MPDAHAARIRANVVNTVRNGLAEFLVDEVMHIDLVGAARRSIVTAYIHSRFRLVLLPEKGAQHPTEIPMGKIMRSGSLPTAPRGRRPKEHVPVESLRNDGFLID